jgi:hypothetical protein
VAVAVAVAVIATLVLVGIWPGVLKLTAPVVCPAGHDEPVVVRDTTQVRPGETNTTVTMYCMNERGEVTDEGILRPARLVFLGVLAGIGRSLPALLSA